MVELKDINELLIRKREIDKITNWSNDSVTYLNEIKKEIQEVSEEIPKERINFLEDELCDVLWDYLNLVSCLEIEKGINLERVISRLVNKYSERIEGKVTGITWDEIKSKQKDDLEKEYNEYWKDKATGKSI